jgi:predicted dehydrogenase
LRVGVLGVGYWGSKHLRVLGGLADVDSVVAIDERLPSMPGMAGLIERGQGFTSLADALPAIDALVIATPPSSHHVLGHQAIAAGKHVLIEKRCGYRRRGGDRGRGRRRRVTLMVGHTFGAQRRVKMLRLVQRQGWAQAVLPRPPGSTSGSTRPMST